MITKEANRRDIEAKLNTMGDYVKIDYLMRCLKQQLDFDSRRFCLVKLSELYEAKKMFLEAGKMLQGAAPINALDKGKINDFVKSAELFIKAGNFEFADIAFEKAMAYGTERDKWDVKQKKIDFYKNQADEYFVKDKRNSAMLAYEKFLSLNITESEKKTAQEKLLALYGRLGKIKEFTNLKRVM